MDKLRTGIFVTVDFHNGDRISGAKVVGTMYGYGEEPVDVLWKGAVIVCWPKDCTITPTPGAPNNTNK